MYMSEIDLLSILFCRLYRVSAKIQVHPLLLCILFKNLDVCILLWKGIFRELALGKSHHGNSKVHNVRLLKVSKTLQIGVTSTKQNRMG